MSSEPLIVIPGRLYTTRETAEYLRVQFQTLEVWRVTGRYPTLEWKRAGGKVLYTGEAILAFLNGPHQKAQPYVPKQRLARVRPERPARTGKTRARKTAR